MANCFFPNEIVIILNPDPQLAQVLPVFRQQQSTSRQITYDVKLFSEENQVLSITSDNIVSLSDIQVKGMPFMQSQVNNHLMPILKEIYDNFDTIVKNMYIPQISFPLGQYQKGNSSVREYLACSLVNCQLVKNQMNSIGDAYNKGRNQLQDALIMQKQFKIGAFQKVCLGNTIKLNNEFFLVKKIYAIHFEMLDNLYFDAELLYPYDSHFVMSGITMQIPAIYQVQVFQSITTLDISSIQINIPVSFIDEKLDELLSPIYIDGIFIPDRSFEQAEVVSDRIQNSNVSSKIKGIVTLFDLQQLFSLGRIPQYIKEDDSQQHFEYYLQKKAQEIQVTKNNQETLTCSFCHEKIQSQYYGIENPHQRAISQLLELNATNGVLTCLVCKQQFHPYCYYSQVADYYIQLTEFVNNGYSFTGINTHCPFCIAKQQNYYSFQECNFLSAFLLNNYNGNTSESTVKALLVQYDIKESEYYNFFKNWHIFNISNQIIALNEDKTYQHFRNITSQYSLEKDEMEITFEQSLSQEDVISLAIVQNPHYNQPFLVQLMSCFDSYFSLNSNMLFWIQIWYEEQDFKEFQSLTVQQVQQLIMQKYGGNRKQPKLQSYDQQKLVKQIKKEEMEKQKKLLTKIPIKIDEQTTNISTTDSTIVQSQPTPQQINQLSIDGNNKVVNINVPLNQNQQVPDQLMAKVFSDAKEEYENQQQEQLINETIILHPPALQRQSKFTKPYDLQSDFKLLKSGVSQALDMLQNQADSELQLMIKNVLQDKKPNYQFAPQIEEPIQKYVPSTESLLNQLLGKSEIKDYIELGNLLNCFAQQLGQPQSQYQQLSQFPASKALQKLILAREILEADKYSEEIQKEREQIKLLNEDDISTIESIRTAISELKAKLIITATELQKREATSQQLELKQKIIAEKQSELSQAFCQLGKDEQNFVQSDILAIQQFKCQLASHFQRMMNIQ